MDRIPDGKLPTSVFLDKYRVFNDVRLLNSAGIVDDSLFDERSR
jgi:hypothetical protein